MYLFVPYPHLLFVPGRGSRACNMYNGRCIDGAIYRRFCSINNCIQINKGYESLCFAVLSMPFFSECEKLDVINNYELCKILLNNIAFWYAFDYVTFCVRTSFSVFSPISRIFFIFFYLEKFSHFKDFFHRNFIMIHYVTLCYILCYIMLHYVTLCYIQCYIMLHYIILHS